MTAPTARLPGGVDLSLFRRRPSAVRLSRVSSLSRQRTAGTPSSSSLRPQFGPLATQYEPCETRRHHRSINNLSPVQNFTTFGSPNSSPNSSSPNSSSFGSPNSKTPNRRHLIQIQPVMHQRPLATLCSFLIYHLRTYLSIPNPTACDRSDHLPSLTPAPSCARHRVRRRRRQPPRPVAP